MKDIIIYGTGGLGRETLLLINEINRIHNSYNLVGFSVDDEYYREGQKIEELPLYSHDWLISRKQDIFCVCAIGYPKDRRRVMKKLLNEGIRFESLIHPNSSVIEKDKIGIGCIIGGYSFVSIGSSLGNGVFLNGQVNIGHDCIIEDYVTCFPKVQVSGGCHIEEAASIGALAFIHENRQVGKESIIAPGSIVLRNVKDKRYAFGNPARIIQL